MPTYSKETTARERELDRKFTAILYPDSTEYECEEVLDRVKNWGYEEWAYILHDRDKKQDGSPKKPHYHLILKKSTPTALITISRQIGISSQYVQRVRNWKKMVKYMTHDEETDKVKYELEELISSDSKKFLEYFKDEDETEQARRILDYITESGCRSYIQLLDWCCANGLYATCRRNASMWSNCIRETEKYGAKNW